MKLKFDINIDIDFSEEQLSKLELYYEERVPELSVVEYPNYQNHLKTFNEEFVEVLRQKYMYEIGEEIKSIIN